MDEVGRRAMGSRSHGQAATPPGGGAGRTARRLWALVVCGLLAAFPMPARGAGGAEAPRAPEAPWIALADGIEFTTFTLPAPNRIYVARMEIGDRDVSLETMIATGDRAGRREAVSRMAERYDHSLAAWGGTWGMTRDVVVAVNGSFYSPSSGVPYGPQVHAGWFSFWAAEQTGSLTFGWTLDRRLLVSECLRTPAANQRLVFSETGGVIRLNGVDIPLPGSGIVLYTPEYTQLVPVVPGSILVIAEVNRPIMLGADGSLTFAAIRQIQTDPHEQRLAFGQVGILARGTAADRLLENASLGSTVGVGLELIDHGPLCQDAAGSPWSDVYAGLGSGVFFLVDGEYRPRTDGTESHLHPRTAICLNQDYVHFIVVDGRRPRWSIGMTLAELSQFCLGSLQATTGINLDGGGSSTMWIDGQVINQPSDGQERAVPDGLMMVRLERSQRSFRFAVGQSVEVSAEVDLRLGPGAGYRSVGTVPAGSRGPIQHPLSGLEGIFASGTYWWPVALEQGSGWLPEPALTEVTATP